METDYTPDYTKEILSHFFIESFVGDRPLNYNSGVHMRTDDCQNTGSAEVGFVGRVLLNAFNAWEYGWKNNRADLKENAAKVFDTYLVNGFSPAGFSKSSLTTVPVMRRRYLAFGVSPKVFMLYFIIWILRKETDVNILSGKRRYVKCLMYSCSCKIRKEVFPVNLRMIFLL